MRVPMNAHEEYFQAVIPTPCSVLNLALRPFSAGHIVHLHRLRSVFVTGGEVTKAELETAVFICAQTFEESCASYQDPETNTFTAKWSRKISGYDLGEKLAAFNDYMAHGSLFPLVFSPKREVGGVSITNLPGVHSVRCALKHYFHISDTEFWNMTWSLAQWDYFTIPVMEGTGDLVEQDSLTQARSFADEDFRRANPQLFNEDGTKKEGAWPS